MPASDIGARITRTELKIQAVERLTKMAAEDAVSSTGTYRTEARENMQQLSLKAQTLREELRQLLLELVEEDDE